MLSFVFRKRVIGVYSFLFSCNNGDKNGVLSIIEKRQNVGGLVLACESDPQEIICIPSFMNEALNPKL